MLPMCWRGSTMGPMVVVKVFIVMVSVTEELVLRDRVVSPTPDPQPGGPGAAFGLASTLKPAQLGWTCCGSEPPLVQPSESWRYTRLPSTKRQQHKRETYDLLTADIYFPWAGLKSLAGQHRPPGIHKSCCHRVGVQCRQFTWLLLIKLHRWCHCLSNWFLLEMLIIFIHMQQVFPKELHQT